MADTTRDVNLRMGVSMKPGSEEFLKNLGSAARDAADQENRLERMSAGVNDRLRERSQLSRDLERTGIRQQELTHEERYQQALARTVTALKDRVRLQQDLERLALKDTALAGALSGKQAEKPGFAGELGAVTGLPLTANLASLTGAVVALTAGLKAADAGLSIYKQSFEYGRFSENKATDALQRWVMEHSPGPASETIGELSRNQFRGAVAGGLRGAIGAVSPTLGALATPYLNSWAAPTPGNESNISMAARQANMRSILEAGQAQRLQGQLDTRRDLQVNQLAFRAAGLEAEAMHGSNSNRQQFGFRVAGTAAAEASLAKAGQTLGGYSREAEQADILRKAELQMSLQSQQAEAQRRLAIGGRSIEAAQGIEGEARKNYQAALGQVGSVNAELGSSGLSEERRFELIEQKKNAQAEADRRDLELRESMKRTEEAITGQLETQKQAQQEKLNLMMGEQRAVTSIVQQERARRQASTEGLGLSNPYQRQAVLNVARKIGRGGELNVRELEFAKQHGDIFGNYLQRIGQQRGAGIMAELLKIPQLGLQAREKAAEQQRIQITQQIEATIKQDNTALVDQLAKVLIPKLNELAQQTKEEARRALENANLQRQSQVRAANGG